MLGTNMQKILKGNLGKNDRLPDFKGFYSSAMQTKSPKGGVGGQKMYVLKYFLAFSYMSTLDVYQNIYKKWSDGHQY